MRRRNKAARSYGDTPSTVKLTRFAYSVPISCTAFEAGGAAHARSYLVDLFRTKSRRCWLRVAHSLPAYPSLPYPARAHHAILPG